MDTDWVKVSLLVDMADSLSLFGISFATLTKSEVDQQISERAALSHGTSVVFANAHVVVESEWNPDFKEVLQKADLIIPDGAPISWVMKFKGEKNIERYSGPDAMENVLRTSSGGKHFFLGSTSQVLNSLQKRFRESVAGTYSPPFVEKDFSDAEKDRQLKLIEEAGADFIWVGLGAPKQEKYVVEMSKRAKRGVWLAVGQAFEVLAGKKTRAPKFMQDLGLEWAFRLASEPRRLAHRYFTTNPAFIRLAVRECLRRQP